MREGDQVKFLSGKDMGRVGRVTKVYPGSGPNYRWPYYFRVRVAGKLVEVTARRLEPYTPDQPPGNYWERP